MREVTYVRAINEAFSEEMARDDSVFLIGEDIADMGGVSGATKGLSTRFGVHRVCQTPLSEAAFVGLAVGRALIGLGMAGVKSLKSRNYNILPFTVFQFATGKNDKSV